MAKKAKENFSNVDQFKVHGRKHSVAAMTSHQGAERRPILILEDVTKSYETGASSLIYPLKDINLKIWPGERIILLGKSGSGKTTFLNLVAGVDSPTKGKIFFDGTEITGLSAEALALYRRKEVGFIFQSFNLFPTLTVGENVMLPLELLGTPDEKKARQMLEAVGLQDQWDQFPERLSGGEQQRVAIARALVKSPKLILADEPTGNLDYDTGNTILRLIDNMVKKQHSTLIMATHSSEALWLADRKFRLKLGSLIEEISTGLEN